MAKPAPVPPRGSRGTDASDVTLGSSPWRRLRVAASAGEPYASPRPAFSSSSAPVRECAALVALVDRREALRRIRGRRPVEPREHLLQCCTSRATQPGGIQGVHHRVSVALPFGSAAGPRVSLCRLDGAQAVRSDQFEIMLRLGCSQRQNRLQLHSPPTRPRLQTPPPPRRMATRTGCRTAMRPHSEPNPGPGGSTRTTWPSPSPDASATCHTWPLWLSNPF